MARWKNRKKNKIRRSKIYLNSLLLSKTRKCSNVVNQMKIKRETSNDQIQVKCRNCKNLDTMKKLCKKLYSWLFDTFFTSSGNLASVVFSKRNFQESKGFVVYSTYTLCVFFETFSLEMDIQWALLWVHFTLFVHKTDTTPQDNLLRSSEIAYPHSFPGIN